MNRPVRIAKALGRAHDKLRGIFNQHQCLKVLSGDQNAGYTTEAIYDTHWYLDRFEYSDVIAGKRYKKVVVDDVEGCRKAKLKAATAFQIGDLIFTFSGKETMDLSAVPSYEFKIYPLHERVS